MQPTGITQAQEDDKNTFKINLKVFLNNTFSTNNTQM